MKIRIEVDGMAVLDVTELTLLRMLCVSRGLTFTPRPGVQVRTIASQQHMRACCSIADELTIPDLPPEDTAP